MIPVLELSGSPREQGRQHGEGARERIERNLEIYFERFEREGHVTRDEVLRRAGLYWDVIQTLNADYAEGVRGVAEGSQTELMEIVALNVRYEILYHQFTQTAMGADGCTGMAVSPETTANGHVLMGENWDWIPQVQTLILKIDTDDDSLVCFTEAGIVGGKIGLNAHGLGLAINGLISTDDDWSRLTKPFHVRCYEILRQRSLEDAVRIVTDGDRPCSANFLIAQADAGIVNVESAPFATRLIRPDQGWVAHTNHFVDPDALSVVEPPSEKRPHSQHRLRKADELLGQRAPIDTSDLQDILRDHDGQPYSICRHIDVDEPPEEHYRTVVSAVMDLHERRMWASGGPPCEHTDHEIVLDEQLSPN